jgi:hypothetical protein
MNSRGLTELIVLQVRISLGVLGGGPASMMVIMAIVTTVARHSCSAAYAGGLEREDSAGGQPRHRTAGRLRRGLLLCPARP